MSNLFAVRDARIFTVLEEIRSMVQSLAFKVDRLLKHQVVQQVEENFPEDVHLPLKESDEVDALERVLQDPEKERKIVSFLMYAFSMYYVRWW